MKRYNKLIRDKILNKLDKNNINYKYHISNKTEYEKKLYKKLLEETKEFLIDKNIDEIADIYEVLEYICKTKGFTKSEISKKRKQKNKKNGKFDKGIILEYTF